jgi:hypothetical protein
MRSRVRAYLTEWPTVYLPLARRKYPGPSPQVIGPDTEFVIDGYTRCASTFAVYALQLPQPRPIRLAHHLHAPAQLIEAARHGVPALAVIRQPREAILSQLIREPGVLMREALIAYARFYECLRSYRECFVVADFEQVTKDFGSVIRTVNIKFGTRFAEFMPTEVNMRRCLDLMSHRDSLSARLLGFESGLVSWADLRDELGPEPPKRNAAEPAWIPSAKRDQAKAALREQWLSPRLAGLRQRADRAYLEFL